MRQALRTWFERKGVINSFALLIVLNAVLLGLETYQPIMQAYGSWLKLADKTILAVFVVELLGRMYAYGRGFWRDGWNVFDFMVVAVALAPANESFAVLRALRVLRVLRLISIFPSMRRVVEGLFAAVPGIASIGAIMLVIFYVFAVMATKLFAADFPHWFGTLHVSLFTLFQIMTLEGWAEIVREIKAVYPWAWVFFLVYIMFSTFTVLNLFIAVIVDGMNRQHIQKVEPVTLDGIYNDLQHIKAHLNIKPDDQNKP